MKLRKHLGLALLCLFVGIQAHAAKKDKGYKTVSGVKYRILKEGKSDGAVAAAGKTVHVQYTGWLWEKEKRGKKFDSSLDRPGKPPFTFTLGAGMVIPGWDKGVEGMKVGETRELIIPPDMGYGASGTPGGPIPPNATLQFEVTLEKVG